jgi:predicted nucleic acid-binding protein
VFFLNQLRAKYKSLRLADSLQLAAAVDCGCNIFITNDVRLKHVTEISVYIIGQE